MLTALLACGCTAPPTATGPAEQGSSRPLVSVDPGPAAPAAQDDGTPSTVGAEHADAEAAGDGPPQELVIRPSGQDAPAPGSPPTVRVAGTTVGPSYPPALVQRVIRTNVRPLRHCYEIQLQRDPNVGGKLVVAFDIVADGTVQGARVESTATRSAELDRCVVGVIANLTFPRPPGGATLHVRYPLVFAPGS